MNVSMVAFLRVLRARPALRRAFLIVVAALALWGAVSAFISSERADAADDLRRDLDAQKIQEVKDAIKRSAPGPRPGRSEFLDCLRRAGPGCL
jgi:hypothetical protein